MKKNLLIFTGLFLLSLISYSQSNLVIFAEDGDAFYAYVNGIRQNDKPETNVKVTGLSANVSLRVEFADKTFPQLKQNMSVESGLEYTVRIKRNAKKELKLRYFGQTPINNDATSGITTVPYHSTENAYNTAPDGSTNSASDSGSGNNISVTSSTTSSTVNPGNVAVNINMSGTGVNMNVNGVDSGMNTSTSTTVTRTLSSSSSYSDGNSTTSSNSAVITNGDCSTAMGATNFDKLKESISSKPFSDTKMSTAKVATKNACLSSNQIKEVCNLFNMDDEKLEYAKYAYNYCVDKANFYRVSEAFSFSTTTDALNTFLEQ